MRLSPSASRSRSSRIALVLGALICIALLAWVLLRRDGDRTPETAPHEEAPHFVAPVETAAPGLAGRGEPAAPPAPAEPAQAPQQVTQASAPPLPVDVEIVAADDGQRLDVPYDVGLGGAIRLSLFLRGGPPKGYLAWDPAEWWIPEVPGARRLRVVYPLRREALVRGVVLGPRGERVEQFERTTVRADGVATTVAIISGSEGFRVHRVPWIPGILVEGWSRAHVGDQEMWGTGSVRIGHDPRAEHVVEIRLDPAAEGPAAAMLPVGSGGAGAAFLGRGRGETGSVRVLVLGRDGRPLLKGKVRLTAYGTKNAITDDRGEVVFERVPAGEVVVAAGQPGFVPVSASVTVETQREAYVVLREPEGGRLDVHVVDADGRSVAFARLAVDQPSGAAWADIDQAGVLRLDPYTDHLGRRSLDGLEPGTIRIRASLGALAGEAEAVTLDRRTTNVEIVVRDPRAATK